MNYEKGAVMITYDILTKPEFKWEPDWTYEQKSELINELLRYFEERDEFEQCVVLRNIMSSIPLGKTENNDEYIDKKTTE